jgi:hypothetical protein
METATNSMPYRTRGDLKAVSLAALWANTQGCLNVPAMSGLTRGQVIAAFAASAGVTIVNANTIGGGIVTKALDLAGKTPFQLIQDYGEVEGWFARSTDDGTGLEIVSEDTILQGAPVFYFDESNTFDCPETTPDRPVTDWILSGTQIGPGALAGIAVTSSTSSTVDGAGNRSSVTTEITTDDGAEIKRVVTSYATVSLPGTIAEPAIYLMVGRVTTTSVWGPYTWVDANGVVQSIPSTALQSRRTMTEALTSVPADTGGYLWVQGGYWGSPYATLMLTQQVDETYTYNQCYQDSSIVTTTQYYSPVVASGGFPYSDGTNRAESTYLWREFSKVETNWSLVEQVVGTNPATETITTTGYFSSIATTAWTTLGAGVDEAYSTSFAMTDTGTPTMGSASVPQFAQQVMVAEYDATAASGYVKNTSSATIDFAESVAELNDIARRRIRRACSDQIAIPHKCIPFLRVGDHVSVTMHSRGLVNVDAYVYSIERTCDVTNGAMEQVTTVNIPPSWI